MFSKNFLHTSVILPIAHKEQERKNDIDTFFALS